MRNATKRRCSDLRARIARLGLTTNGMARRMQELGDDRSESAILRAIQRMIAGDARQSGEMLALLGLMELVQDMSPNERLGIKLPSLGFLRELHELEVIASVQG